MIGRDEVEIEVEAWTPDHSGMGVRLTHKKTGLVAECSEHPSHTANYDVAIADLERQLAALAQPKSRVRQWLRRFANPS